MPNVFVKPRRGEDGKPVLVRQPNRDFLPLPASGAWVTLDDYWSRRLRDEDVVEADPPAEPDPETSDDASDDAPATKARKR